jgi:hypothetical protein
MESDGVVHTQSLISLALIVGQLARQIYDPLGGAHYQENNSQPDGDA